MRIFAGHSVGLMDQHRVESASVPPVAEPVAIRTSQFGAGVAVSTHVLLGHVLVWRRRMGAQHVNLGFVSLSNSRRGHTTPLSSPSATVPLREHLSRRHPAHNDAEGITQCHLGWVDSFPPGRPRLIDLHQRFLVCRSRAGFSRVRRLREEAPSAAGHELRLEVVERLTTHPEPLADRADRTAVDQMRAASRSGPVGGPRLRRTPATAQTADLARDSDRGAATPPLGDACASVFVGLSCHPGWRCYLVTPVVRRRDSRVATVIVARCRLASSIDLSRRSEPCCQCLGSKIGPYVNSRFGGQGARILNRTGFVGGLFP